MTDCFFFFFFLLLSGSTRSPDAVENISILEYPQQFVVRRDLVEVCPLFIGEEQVRFPNGVQHGGVQVQGVVWVLLVGQPWIVPLLPQEHVEPVVLTNGTKPSLQMNRIGNTTLSHVLFSTCYSNCCRRVHFI